MNGRAITDSPEYKGDLFFIETPDASVKGGYLVHKVSTNINAHQTHMDLMHEAGNHNFIERKVKR